MKSTFFKSLNIIIIVDSLSQYKTLRIYIFSYRLRNAIKENEFSEQDKRQYKDEKLYKYMSFAIERHNYAIRLRIKVYY